jgi:cytochrome d ubiquinol oxidase subunit I
MYKWWRTKDRDYYDATRIVTSVLGLNFALGAITGTLVEFGLVQAWPGTIFVIATFAFVPLTLELVAFLGEVLFLVMFIVTLGKVKAPMSIVIMVAYAAMAMSSGAVIATVNSWLNVPWGTANLATTLYPFLPSYGPNAIDLQALVRLKAEFVQNVVATGSSAQILQNATIANNVGVTLTNPFIAFSSPYALATIFHAVNAAMIVGVSFGLTGFAYRFFKTGSVKYVKIMRAILPILLVMLILQPTVLGDFMGKTVAEYQPTKFALMEGAQTTTQNPLSAFLAYGDPQHSIPGLEDFEKACQGNSGKTLGQLVSSIIPNLNIGPASSTDLGALCLSDLSAAGAVMPAINIGYDAKIAAGIIALISLVGLASVNFSLGPLSNLTSSILAPLGRKRGTMLLSLMVLSACVLAAALGWFIREVGRRPWTVYGLLYPQELITPVPINPIVLKFFVLTFVVVALVGVYGMYLVVTRPLRFLQLLKEAPGVD